MLWIFGNVTLQRKDENNTGDLNEECSLPNQQRITEEILKLCDNSENKSDKKSQSSLWKQDIFKIPSNCRQIVLSRQDIY